MTNKMACEGFGLLHQVEFRTPQNGTYEKIVYFQAHFPTGSKSFSSVGHTKSRYHFSWPKLHSILDRRNCLWRALYIEFLLRIWIGVSHTWISDSYKLRIFIFLSVQTFKLYELPLTFNILANLSVVVTCYSCKHSVSWTQQRWPAW